MATPDVRAVYELLRRAMQQQSLQQPGADFGPTPGATSEPDSDSYGGPQGGLLGRLQALQAGQSPQQPPAGNNGPIPSEARDSNFRQLSRVPSVDRPQGTTATYDRLNDQSRPSYSPVGSSIPFDSLSASPQGGGLFGTHGGQPVPPWVIPSPGMTPAPIGWRIRGIPIPVPFPPTGPGTIPQIPMPAVPDWMNVAGAIPQLLRKSLSQGGGGGGGGGKGADDNEDGGECHKRWYDEYYGHCEQYRPFGIRYRDACRDQAAHRLRLCERNGGVPDPDEPQPYDWSSIPRDPAGR